MACKQSNLKDTCSHLDDTCEYTCIKSSRTPSFFLIVPCTNTEIALSLVQFSHQVNLSVNLLFVFSCPSLFPIPFLPSFLTQNTPSPPPSFKPRMKHSNSITCCLHWGVSLATKINIMFTSLFQQSFLPRHILIRV